MNCYEFELNLSNFIEGELKQKEITNFMTHQKGCVGCGDKLKSMVIMLSNLGNLKTVDVSHDFTIKLHHKISKLENKQISKSWNLRDILSFGMEPNHAIAFGFSIVLVITSLIYFSLIDKVPTIKMADYQNVEIIHPNTIPSLSADSTPFQYAVKQDSIDNKSLNQNKLSICRLKIKI